MRDSERDADVQNRLFDSVEEGEGGMIWENSIETCIISYEKQIASLGSRGWCTGITQRDGKGSEVGGEFRSGNLCTPVADSC